MEYEVLIFDDDPSVGRLTLTVFENEGYSAKLFSDGRKAVELVRDLKPRLVVLDILMPGNDGLTLCRILKSRPDTNQVRIIIMSGKSYAAEKQRAIRGRADLFLEKPFDPVFLVNEVARLVGRPLKESVPFPAADVSTAVKAVFWGCFGPPWGKFEGPTSCVSIHCPDGLFVLDAGTGMRNLAQALLKRGEPEPVWVLLTHYHADHISGLEAFLPVLEAGHFLHIGGPCDPDYPVEQLVQQRLLARATTQARSQIRIYTFFEDTYLLGPEVRLQALHANHPGPTLCFSLDVSGKKIVYCPASEVSSLSEAPARDYREKLVRFCLGADILIHDAQYTEDEYQAHRGQGGSSFEEAVVLAIKAGVRKLVLFHVSPVHDSQELNSILDQAKYMAAKSPRALECHMAYEGLLLDI